jgi:hypothetical protein
VVEQRQFEGLSGDFPGVKKIGGSETGISAAFEDRHDQGIHLYLAGGYGFDSDLHQYRFCHVAEIRAVKKNIPNMVT